MSITFIPAQVQEHELGAYLGSFEISSKRDGNFEFYFPTQESYLELIGNKLYLDSTWEYDFETKNVFEFSSDGTLVYYDFSASETPIKFVYSDLDSDWIYAELNFLDIDEGPLTFRGWQSPWAPTSNLEKSGVYYIDALLPDLPEKWETDTHYSASQGDASTVVITYSFIGISNEESKFSENYDDWKT